MKIYVIIYLKLNKMQIKTMSIIAISKTRVANLNCKNEDSSKIPSIQERESSAVQALVELFKKSTTTQKPCVALTPNIVPTQAIGIETSVPQKSATSEKPKDVLYDICVFNNQIISIKPAGGMHGLFGRKILNSRKP